MSVKLGSTAIGFLEPVLIRIWKYFGSTDYRLLREGEGCRYEIKPTVWMGRVETPSARFLVRAFCAARVDTLDSQSMKGDTIANYRNVLTTRLEAI